MTGHPHWLFGRGRQQRRTAGAASAAGGGVPTTGIHQDAHTAGTSYVIGQGIQVVLNLTGTPQGQAGFADAYIVRHRGGPERVVALFDPAGGDLLRQGPTEEFLWIADGLFFMVDPDRQVNARQERDAAFATSLDVIRASGRRDQVSAAIILGKADKVRFEAPVERWLRAGSESLDADDFLAESADVYAYLDGQGTEGTEAFHVCGRATLHFASATGSSDEGGRFQRGVRPRRALRPLLAMLAMTGILTGPEAEEIGRLPAGR